jgi:hypothetical protein
MVLLYSLFIFYFSFTKENFGMSPGTMQQLESTRVQSPEEQRIQSRVNNDLVQRDIYDMTESDITPSRKHNILPFDAFSYKNHAYTGSYDLYDYKTNTNYLFPYEMFQHRAFPAIL